MDLNQLIKQEERITIKQLTFQGTRPRPWSQGSTCWGLNTEHVWFLDGRRHSDFEWSAIFQPRSFYIIFYSQRMTEASHSSVLNGRFHSYRHQWNGPFQNGTILNQNIKTFRIGMAFGVPSSVFKPPLQCFPIRVPRNPQYHEYVLGVLLDKNATVTF